MTDQEYVNEETYVIPIKAGDVISTIFDRFMAHYSPFGFQSPQADIVYHALPYTPGDDDPLLLKQPWRVSLELYVEEHRMMLGVDLYGDVILGRGKSQPGRIVIDLDPYNARELGVSRDHVMLRATTHGLFLIDRGSTNGTTVNGSPAGRGVAIQLNDQDLIHLSKMVMMVHIVSRPGEA